MARPQVKTAMGIASVVGPMFIAATIYFIVPLLLVIIGATDALRPGGFGRGLASLLKVGLRSVFYAIVPALAATAFCTVASLLARFHRRFGQFYCIWLVATLFTNPVFIVFGFTILLSSIPTMLAVLLASAYVLMPLCGLIVHGAVGEFPIVQIRAARSLGASPVLIAVYHILPAIRGQILVSIVLGSAYALGFYLIPSYVGLGRVVTLATTIDHTANQVGDWSATCQLCIVTLSIQVLLLALWMLAKRALCRQVEGIG